MRLAVIPARGGSKRIPRKNVKAFNGKPMIVWSVEAALDSGCFDRVIVSTDDDEIMRIASAAGAEAPFRRPDELANDFVATVPVIAHAINWFAEQGEIVDEVCCLYATAPFVDRDDLRKGLETLVTGRFDFVVPVTTFPFPIQRALKLDEAGRASMVDPSFYGTRSQDLEERFHDVGQFYWGQARSWTTFESVYTAQTGVIEVPRYRVQDIDTLEDWTRAELMHQALAISQEEAGR